MQKLLFTQSIPVKLFEKMRRNKFRIHKKINRSFFNNF